MWYGSRRCQAPDDTQVDSDMSIEKPGMIGWASVVCCGLATILSTALERQGGTIKSPWSSSTTHPGEPREQHR